MCFFSQCLLFAILLFVCCNVGHSDGRHLCTARRWHLPLSFGGCHSQRPSLAGPYIARHTLWFYYLVFWPFWFGGDRVKSTARVRYYYCCFYLWNWLKGSHYVLPHRKVAILRPVPVVLTICFGLTALFAPALLSALSILEVTFSFPNIALCSWLLRFLNSCGCRLRKICVKVRRPLM